MSLIGNLVSSGNATFNLDFLPSVILIENLDVDIPLSNLSVVTGGNQLMSITSAGRIQALAKYQQGAVLGADVKVPMSLALAIGRVNKQTTINATNGSATTPAVYASSTGKTTIARMATETSINPSANGSFQNFEALFFLPTNVLRAQITFENGFSDEFTTAELDAMFARSSTCDADGRLAGHTVIDGSNIANVTLYNGSGGSTIVLKSNFVDLK